MNNGLETAFYLYMGVVQLMTFVSSKEPNIKEQLQMWCESKYRLKNIPRLKNLVNFYHFNY